MNNRTIEIGKTTPAEITKYQIQGIQWGALTLRFIFDSHIYAHVSLESIHDLGTTIDEWIINGVVNV